MKIQAISNNHYGSRPSVYQTKHERREQIPIQSPTFEGKHDCAKFFGGVTGVLGTLGAIGGTILLGGFSLPIVAAYGAASALLGVGIGHEIDKGIEKQEKEDSDKNQKTK